MEGCKLLLCSITEREHERRCHNCRPLGGVGSSGYHARPNGRAGLTKGGCGSEVGSEVGKNDDFGKKISKGGEVLVVFDKKISK